jgi:transglutaminase 1
MYTVITAIFVRTSYYTGEAHSLVKEQRTEVMLAPESEEELTMLVQFDEYEPHLVDQNSFEVSVAADVIGTNYQFQGRDDFRVRMPDIKFEFEGSAVAGKPLTVHAILDNPIPRTLTRCYFLIEGAGLTEPLKIPVKRYEVKKVLNSKIITIFFFHRNIPVGGEGRVTFQIIPKSPGEKTISGKFVSRELGTDIDGYRNIRVAQASPYDDVEFDINENVTY